MRSISSAWMILVPVWLAAGCSGGGSSLCDDNGVTVTIQENHPNGDHEMVVSAADVAAGEEVVYDIQGDNTGHGHDVTVTADDFASLEDGDVVTLTSSDTGAVGQDHTHVVVLDCNPQE